MSVFIMDATGVDSITWPLELYAQAELLVFQNRFGEAIEKLDSIPVVYPEHNLEDDMFYLKAKIAEKQRKFDDATKLYERILEKYADGIRADNSLYRLAELQEQFYRNNEKAKELYEKLFVDFSGSTLAVEARKRYRILRGDNI
jgi:TolA-binding protein